MDPKLEDEKRVIEQTVGERQSGMSREEVAAKLQESAKPGEDISSDMDEAARLAEEALKRLEGEM